jgi:hypothetical protein
MKTEYRITIGQRREGPQQKRRAYGSKLEVVKAVLLTLLALSAVIGVFLAAAVLGSIIATILLILIAIALVILAIRRLFLLFKRGQTKL